jgi:hypothetical protein
MADRELLLRQVANGQTAGAYPASAPPPIQPWNDFDPTEVNDYCLAVKLIAEILMDDEWHDKLDIIEEVEEELELPRDTIKKLIYYLRIHGDIRLSGEDIRLTTRWRGWHPADAMGGAA